MVGMKFLGRLFVGMVLTANAFAQPEKLFVPVDEKVLSAAAAKKVEEIKARKKSRSSGLFKLNISVVEARSCLLDLPNGQAVAMQRQFLQKHPKYVAYAASSEVEFVHLTLVTSGAGVFGTLHTQFGTFSIEAVDDEGTHLMSAVEPAAMPMHAPGPRAMAPPILEQREREYQEEMKKRRGR